MRVRRFVDAAVSHPLELARLDLPSGAAGAHPHSRMGAAEPTCSFCGYAIGMPTQPVVDLKHEGERQTSWGPSPSSLTAQVSCSFTAPAHPPVGMNRLRRCPLPSLWCHDFAGGSPRSERTTAAAVRVLVRSLASRCSQDDALTEFCAVALLRSRMTGL